MAINPVEIVVARAGIADHFPRDHVAIAAIDWIGKKPLLHIFQNFVEERLCVGVVEVQLFLVEFLQNEILVEIAELGKTFSVKLRTAVAVERRERLAIELGRVVGDCAPCDLVPF